MLSNFSILVYVILFTFGECVQDKSSTNNIENEEVDLFVYNDKARTRERRYTAIANNGTVLSKVPVNNETISLMKRSPENDMTPAASKTPVDYEGAVSSDEFALFMGKDEENDESISSKPAENIDVNNGAFKSKPSNYEGKTTLSSVSSGEMALFMGNDEKSEEIAPIILPEKKEEIKPSPFLVDFEIGFVEPNSKPNDKICFSKGWDVGKVGLINITTLNYRHPVKTYEANMTCIMTFQGSRICTPVFGCYKRLSLRKRINRACTRDYIRLEDGLGGSSYHCGNDRVPLQKASRGGRDLFLKFRSGPLTPKVHTPKLFKGISCYVKCMDTVSEMRRVVDLESSFIRKKRRANCKCGTGPLSKKPGHLNHRLGRIIGGLATKIDEFPFLVPIVMKGTRHIRCGGSIINSRFILTAAHCFEDDGDSNGRHFEVLVHARLLGLSFPPGEYPTKDMVESVPGYELDDVTDSEENTTRYSVIEKIVHPLFSTETLDTDIALLKLDRPIEFNTTKGVPICLPEHRRYDDSYNFEDDPYVNIATGIAGWGKAFSNSAAYSRLPMKISGMPVIPFSKCQSFMPPEFELTERMFCASFLEGGRDSCQGDSGSPLFFERSNHTFLQLGINSWGDDAGCALKDSPGVYTDLRPLMQWIYYHTMKPSVFWCKD